jgi:hypothetical protein
MKRNAKRVREKLKTSVTHTVTKENFKRLCGLNGLTPDELFNKIERHKTTVYMALRKPTQFKPTIKLIEDALPIRQARPALQNQEVHSA